MIQRLACWRFRTWNARLNRRRTVLWRAEAIADSTGGIYDVSVAEHAETLVNRALVKRNKWKKRACENCRRRVQRSEA